MGVEGGVEIDEIRELKNGQRELDLVSTVSAFSQSELESRFEQESEII